jgi:Domain of unknown function (DUF932)
MRENGWVPVRAQEQSIRTEARRGFQKHVVRFARAEHLQTWGKNQVRPEVVLVNSHDKSSANRLLRPDGPSANRLGRCFRSR